MVVEMLEVEDQQYVPHSLTPLCACSDVFNRRRFKLRYPKVGTVRNPLHVAEILEKRANLRRRLQGLRDIQALHMPCVPSKLAHYRTAHASASAPTSVTPLATRLTTLRTAAVPAIPEPDHGPENEPIFLPNTLSCDELEVCAAGIAEMESRLRVGQLRSSLDKLRLHLHMKSRMLTFKAQNVRNQASTTRALAQLSSNEGKIIAFANKYRAARLAYLELNGPGIWEEEWRELRQSDIRLLRSENAPAPDEQGTEGRREVSWIWKGGDRHLDNAEAGVVPGLDDGMYNTSGLPLYNNPFPLSTARRIPPYTRPGPSLPGGDPFPRRGTAAHTRLLGEVCRPVGEAR